MQTIKEKDTPCFAIVAKPKSEVFMKPLDKPKKENWWENVGPKEVRELLMKYHGIVAGSILESLPPKERLVIVLT